MKETFSVKSKKVKFVIAGVAVIIILAAALTTFSRGAEKPEGAAQTTVITVDMEKPSVKNIQNTDELIGVIEAKNSAFVYPKISGEVERVSVKTGDTVSAGQVLCVIENDGQSSAASNADSALIALQDAKTALERTKLLYENGGVSQEAYEQARSACERAQIQYDSALNSYGDQVDYSQVTAPISGRVEIFDIKAHDNVSSQTQICVIAGGEDKVVKFSASEKAAAALKNGDYVKVEKNGTAYDAVVTEISTMVDDSTGLFEIKAEVREGQGLATNTSVKVTLISEESGDGLALPLSAVYYDGGEAYVYICQDGIARKTPVKTGLSSEESIEILSGVTGDDNVITTWSASLREGVRVMKKGSEEVGTGGAVE